MNKRAFLEELKKILSEAQVTDLDEIIADYEEHFARKGADGYTEEEIARKLGNPTDLAKDYAGCEKQASSPAKIPLAVGTLITDLVIAPLFAAAFAWVAALAVGSVSFVLIGFSLAASPLFPLDRFGVPYLPHIPGALLGLSVVSLGILFGILTVYCFLLVQKTGTAFLRRQKSVMTGKKSAPYALYPLTGHRAKRVFRLLTLVSLAGFFLFCTAAFVMMAIEAGAFEFWHVWGWFSYVG